MVGVVYDTFRSEASNAEVVRCVRCNRWPRSAHFVPTEGVRGVSTSVRDEHGLGPAPLAALAHRRRRRELGAWHRPAKEDVTLGGLHLDLRALVNARSMLGIIGTWCRVHATAHTQKTTGRTPLPASMCPRFPKPVTAGKPNSTSQGCRAAFQQVNAEATAATRATGSRNGR